MLVDVGTQCADMGKLGLTTYIRVQSRKGHGQQAGPARKTPTASGTAEFDTAS